MFRRDGSDITREEAVGVFEPYGEIENVANLGTEAQQVLSFPKTFIVKFRFWDNTRDVHVACLPSDGLLASHLDPSLITRYQMHRNNPDYHIKPYDTKNKKPVESKFEPVEEDAAFLTEYEQDHRCVYVGNLPVDLHEEEFSLLMANPGKVLGIRVVKREDHNGE